MIRKIVLKLLLIWRQNWFRNELISYRIDYPADSDTVIDEFALMGRAAVIVLHF
jgi:hypothetical protein